MKEFFQWAVPPVMLLVLIGCGTTKNRTASEQLLKSSAVDNAVADIDFRALSGEKVYLDTQYIEQVKDAGFVNQSYIISSLRQQMMAAGCRLQDKPEEADYVVEARVGALGADEYEVVYGIPANNLLSTASSVVPTLPNVPTIPEISVAKKNDQLAAAKLGVFAYHRESRVPVWQSGMAKASSTSKNTWVLGAGPLQSGSIHKGPKIAGSELRLPLWKQRKERYSRPPIPYQREYHFQFAEKSGAKNPSGAKQDASSPVQPASGEEASGAPEKKPAEAQSTEPSAQKKKDSSGVLKHLQPIERPSSSRQQKWQASQNGERKRHSRPEQEPVFRIPEQLNLFSSDSESIDQ